MQPLQRLSAFLRQQLFLMSKRASFTSATSLISPSRASTTTWIHPGRWEHYSSARHFYWERVAMKCMSQGFLCSPQTPCFTTPAPLCCCFQALSQQLSFDLWFIPWRCSLWTCAFWDHHGLAGGCNSYCRHQSSKQSLPLPFSWPTGWKTLKPLLWTSSNLQRHDRIKKNMPFRAIPTKF